MRLPQWIIWFNEVLSQRNNKQIKELVLIHDSLCQRLVALNTSFQSTTLFSFIDELKKIPKFQSSKFIKRESTMNQKIGVNKCFYIPCQSWTWKQHLHLSALIRTNWTPQTERRIFSVWVDGPIYNRQTDRPELQESGGRRVSARKDRAALKLL